MWNLIDSEWADGDRLDLYEREGVHMIRVNGWELMNGAHHASEDRLGRLAGMISRARRPRILLGGLGLGFTLRSLMETLGTARHDITVAERSAAVLRWFETHSKLPPGVRLCECDVAAHLGTDRCWDVIVLDVDNGPEALSTAGNATLYDATGLRRCRDSLRPGGHLLLWSGFEDGGFVERASATGFSVARDTVPLPNRPSDAHILYVLSRAD